MNEITLKEENWFWCDLCEAVTYSYGCECQATSCNCGGCDKCAPLHPIVEEATKQKNHPPIDKLKRTVIDNYKKYILNKEYKNVEEILLQEIFGVPTDSILMEIAKLEVSSSYGK